MELNPDQLKELLKKIWDVSNGTKCPQERANVQKIFQSITKQVKEAVDNLKDKSSKEISEIVHKDFFALSGLLDEIEVQREEAENLAKSKPDEAAAAAAKRLEKQLDDFYEEICQWRTLLFGLASGANENARAQFASAGQWAIHFSVVRMTVTTFFVGLSWALISVKWDDYTDDLGRAAWGIWLLAGFFLAAFTWETNAEAGKQKYCKSFIPHPGSSEKNTKPVRGFGWLNGWVLAVIGIVLLLCCVILLRNRMFWVGVLGSIFLILLVLSVSSNKGYKQQCLGLGANFWIWVPVLIYLWLTYGYSRLVDKWENHPSRKHVELAALVAPTPGAGFEVTNRSESSTNVFIPVNFSAWETNLPAALVQLANIRNALSNLPPSGPTGATPTAYDFAPLVQELRQIQCALTNPPAFRPPDRPAAPANSEALLKELENIQSAIERLPTNLPPLHAHEAGVFIGIGKRELQQK